MASSPSSRALAELGVRLRRAGLRESLAMAAYGGATGIHAARLAARAAPLPASPASAALELLVAGREVERGAAAQAIGDLDVAIAAGLLEPRGDRLVAAVRVVPFGELFLACDPGQLPDDSSLHLIGALPRRVEGPWLDVGTGCGVAPLSRPRLGSARLGTDIDAAAIERAALGAALSGCAAVARFAAADLFDGVAGLGGPFALITFNAPLPLPPGLLDRFWAGAPRLLELGGEIAVHARIAEAPDLGGEVRCLTYTPPQAPAPFSVIRWRPDQPPSRRRETVALTCAIPHISRSMFDRC